MRTLACLAALLALCVALCVHAEVYKWVDEKGQTQYGETPPAGAATTRMKVPPPPDTPSEKPAEKPKEAATKQPATDERKTRCEFERKQQELLDASDPIIYKDAKGDTVALDEAKRAAAKERVRENIKKYCS
jgi:Domain of unknown function (DUF4124)